MLTETWSSSCKVNAARVSGAVRTPPACFDWSASVLACYQHCWPDPATETVALQSAYADGTDSDNFYPMRVQFTYTQEDMVDASTRVLARSKMIRKWRLMELVWTLLLTWAIVFLIFRNDVLKAVLLASATALIMVVFVRLFQPVIIERKLRKYVKDRHRDENAFPCEVELTPGAVLIQAQSTHATLEWQTVEEIKVTAGSVDIFGRDGGVIVRDRAFTSAAEKNEFVKLAQGYLAAATPS